MQNARLSLMGIEKYLNETKGISLFDDIELPDGIEKDTLVLNIVNECADFNVLYSDPEYLALMIKLFFKKWAYTFNKWVYLADQEFNPLYNFDRHEHTKDTTKGSNTLTLGTKNVSEMEHGHIIDENANTYSNSNTPRTKETNSGTDKSTDTASGTNKNVSDITVEHDGTLQGNIGVTESTTMGLHYLDYVKQINIINNITDMFISEFCVLVY